MIPPRHSSMTLGSLMPLQCLNRFVSILLTCIDLIRFSITITISYNCILFSYLSFFYCVFDRLLCSVSGCDFPPARSAVCCMLAGQTGCIFWGSVWNLHLVEPPALSKMAVMVSDIHVTARTCHGRQRKRASANVMTGVMLLLSEPRHQISTLHVPCGLLTKISYFCLPFTSLMNTLLLGSVFFPTIFMCAIVSVTIQLQPQRINTALSYSKCPNLPCPNKLLTHLQEFH